MLGQQQLQFQCRLIILSDACLRRLQEEGLNLVSPEDIFKILDRFTVIPAGPGEFRLHSLTFSLALHDGPNELLAHLLPMIDGKRTVAELMHGLKVHAEISIKDALDYLLKMGALERVNDSDPHPLTVAELARYQSQIAFFANFVAPPQASGGNSWPGIATNGLDYQKRIRQARVVVFGAGRVGSHLVRSLVLAGVGKITVVDSESVGKADLFSDAWFASDQVGCGRADAICRLACSTNPAVDIEAAREPAGSAEWHELLGRSDFAVLCRDHFNPAEYETVNQAALETKKSWTSARLAGLEFQIGPTVIPFQTACYRCFDLRQKSNAQDFAEYQLVEDFLRKGRLQIEALAFTPATGLVALEVLKAITWFVVPSTCSHLYTLNLLTMESKFHPVLKIPRCPACGRPAQPRPTIHAWQQSKRDLTP
jgi:bacteriocin biosynthesis cyclodehydratase domain-containing protein